MLSIPPSSPISLSLKERPNVMMNRKAVSHHDGGGDDNGDDEMKE
jgi:hypothetical protein